MNASGAAQTTSAPLVLADQGFFWVGVNRIESPFGLVASGQMYVRYQIPAERRHRYPIVMVHGGGGQGLDYLGTPDGRPGWATWFVRAGYAVYVVDRVAHGRSPHHHDVNGPGTPPANYTFITTMFTGCAKKPTYPQASLHSQWPGSGEVGDPTVDQLIAGMGPMLGSLAANQHAMQRCGVELLDRIGPATLMTHSMGGPFGYLVADLRPKLVKAMVVIEPVGPAFAEVPGLGGLEWGLTAIPVTYDPPARTPADLKRQMRPASAAGLKDCPVQAEPARQLINLKGIPIAVVCSQASWMAQFTHGTRDYLVQAGADAELLRLEDAGIRGNGHLMMVEKNSDEVAAYLESWIRKKAAA